MALVNIREYKTLPTDEIGNVVLAGLEPALVATSITPTGTSAQHEFHPETQFAYISSEEVINWAMSPDGNPVAVVDGAGRLAASFIFIGIDQSNKSPQKIAVIVDT